MSDRSAVRITQRLSKKMKYITLIFQQNNWRWFSRGLIVLLLTALSMNATPASQAHRPAKKQPNIIWLILDDASPTLGCYGDAQAITPNMDRLAREGARFTRAFTHAPVCA